MSGEQTDSSFVELQNNPHPLVYHSGNVRSAFNRYHPYGQRGNAANSPQQQMYPNMQMGNPIPLGFQEQTTLHPKVCNRYTVKEHLQVTNNNQTIIESKKEEQEELPNLSTLNRDENYIEKKDVKMGHFFFSN